ncbi:MAG: glutathione S-transferase N-terminal domain-containing protein [Candidatus Omnitrophica bacterium]|nr:glutathione S-transferase N-terminal domain-containing protein [Candidatus Omnitrophota bacterium]
MAKSVSIYTTRTCPHCVRAKDLLKRKGIAFQEIDVTDNAGKRREAEERYGWLTVPIIVIGDQCIGGADELFRLEGAGQLSKYLKSG